MCDLIKTEEQCARELRARGETSCYRDADGWIEIK